MIADDDKQLQGEREELVTLLRFMREQRLALVLMVVVGAIAGFAQEHSRDRFFEGSVSIAIGSVGVIGQKVAKNEDVPGGDWEFISGVRYHGLEPGRRLLTTPSELYRVLRVRYSIPEAKSGLRPTPFVDNIDNMSGDGLKIYAKGDSAEQVEAFLSKIVEVALEDLQDRFLPTQQLLLDLRELLNRKLNSQNDSSSMAELVDRLYVSSSTAELVDRLYEVDRALSPINTRPSEVVERVNVYPPKPRKYLLAGLIGGGVGLLAGLLALLLVNLSNLITKPK